MHNLPAIEDANVGGSMTLVLLCSGDEGNDGGSWVIFADGVAASMLKFSNSGETRRGGFPANSIREVQIR